MIGDEICVISAAADGVRILPTYPRLRLWRDAVDALGFDAQSLPRALSGKDKYLVDCPDGFPTEAVPLGDVVVLQRELSRRKLSLERLRGTAAVQAIASNIYVRRPANALGLQRSYAMSSSLRLAHQHHLTIDLDGDMGVGLTQARMIFDG